ncbi:hypothetical protein BDZ89DRAFT_799889 [Hymenopellis radicata]|nr:hypothetical protein BDZ89DRAFT_799889 [Hymenopellis radicata]
MSECSRCGFKPAVSPVPDSQQSPWNIDVLELLRSGHTPSSAVAPSIPGRVAALEARYQAMKDDLTSLVVLVAQLRTEMESTEAEIEQIKSLAAPIRSLPREILLRRVVLATCADFGARCRALPHVSGRTSKFTAPTQSRSDFLGMFFNNILSFQTRAL